VISIWPNKFLMRNIILIVGLIAGCAMTTMAADTITGVVRNQTRGQFAAGDDAILLRLDQGMQEEARTQADSQGAFSLAVRYPDKMHLVRVVHQGVNYDQRASAGDVVSIDVFDADANVQGITGSIEIIRTGTNGNLLHVSDMIEIKNDSRPPLTLAGERTFEVYLPADAKIDSVLAAASGRIGVIISATPALREPGHYTVNFPLRPGATKFAFNYDLPYSGRVTFHPRSQYPLQQLAVMIPPTMSFASHSTAFEALPAGNNRYQVQAANHLQAGQGPEFEISGVGTLPAMQPQVQSSPRPPTTDPPVPSISVTGNSRAQTQGATIIEALPASALSTSSSQVQRRILGVGAVLVFAVCGFLLWRRERRSASAMTPERKADGPRQVSASLADVLKEELVQLEVDRSRGTISGEEYDSAKQALEGTVKRALARVGAKA